MAEKEQIVLDSEAIEKCTKEVEISLQRRRTALVEALRRAMDRQLQHTYKITGVPIPPKEVTLDSAKRGLFQVDSSV
jgi:hypothetical protein